MSRRLGLALALSAVLQPGIGAAQDAGAAPGAGATAAPVSGRVALHVTPSPSAALGQVVTLALDVHAKAEEEVSVPEQTLAPFEVVDRRVRETPSAQGGGRDFVFELDVIALEPGELTIPALNVRVVSAKGELSELHTDPKPLRITSPLANEPSAAPKPAAEPVSVMEDDYTLAWIGGSVLAIAAVAALTLFISRLIKRRPQPLPPPVPEIPPWEQALSKLAALSASRDAMLAEARGAEFVETAGNVVREYLGKRYGFDGLERTTDELMHTLTELRPAQVSMAKLTLLLEQCDLVKFARVTPDLAVCDELFGDADALVRASIPGGGLR